MRLSEQKMRPWLAALDANEGWLQYELEITRTTWTKWKSVSINKRNAIAVDALLGAGWKEIVDAD